jgi:D-proline reductase (dithiol) PrdB
VIVQRAIEKAGIPTIIIAALPPVVKQQGSPRYVAPRVPMGANAGAPNDKEMQTGIIKDTLNCLMEFDHFGQGKALPYEYKHT